MKKSLPVLGLGIIFIIIVGILAIAADTAKNSSTSQTPTTTVPQTYECNADGMVCPDGSVVGRTGADCHFAACHVALATSTTIGTTIGQKMTGMNVSITPLEVTQDSRCPADVQCIWAGTVKVRTKIESGMGTSEMELELGTPITTEAEEITLVEVTPGKVSQEPIAVSSYRFVFEVKKR